MQTHYLRFSWKKIVNWCHNHTIDAGDTTLCLTKQFCRQIQGGQWKFWELKDWQKTIPEQETNVDFWQAMRSYVSNFNSYSCNCKHWLPIESSHKYPPSLLDPYRKFCRKSQAHLLAKYLPPRCFNFKIVFISNSKARHFMVKQIFIKRILTL